MAEWAGERFKNRKLKAEMGTTNGHQGTRIVQPRKNAEDAKAETRHRTSNIQRSTAKSQVKLLTADEHR